MYSFFVIHNHNIVWPPFPFIKWEDEINFSKMTVMGGWEIFTRNGGMGFIMGGWEILSLFTLLAEGC